VTVPNDSRPLWEIQADQAAQDGTRLQKVLAERGYASRRKCEELIEAGRVTVNGDVAVLGRRIHPDTDIVLVDGVPVAVRPGMVYFILNKPAGVVTTASDPQGRPTVVQLVPDDVRVFPVGRLDAETEGLLILTPVSAWRRNTWPRSMASFRLLRCNRCVMACGWTMG
jgi:23S rRNA pseudouridine2605 synthase